ncbi:hypothetical protein LSAT2_006227 [Lamellibrachia satsuma]|nr:hypothetical protein LSAT2_006227 [Lamellibrachia satsuma]
MSAIVSASRPVVLFKSSAGRPSLPLAQPLFRLPIARLTSSPVIGFVTSSYECWQIFQSWVAKLVAKGSAIRGGVTDNASGVVMDRQLGDRFPASSHERLEAFRAVVETFDF